MVRMGGSVGLGGRQGVGRCMGLASHHLTQKSQKKVKARLDSVDSMKVCFFAWIWRHGWFRSDLRYTF